MKTLDCFLRYIFQYADFEQSKTFFVSLDGILIFPFTVVVQNLPSQGSLFCFVLFFLIGNISKILISDDASFSVLDIQKLHMSDGIEIVEFSFIWELYCRKILPFLIPTVSLRPSQFDMPAQILFVSFWVILQHGEKRDGSSLSVSGTSGLTSQLFQRQLYLQFASLSNMFGISSTLRHPLNSNKDIPTSNLINLHLAPL